MQDVTPKGNLPTSPISVEPSVFPIETDYTVVSRAARKRLILRVKEPRRWTMGMKFVIAGEGKFEVVKKNPNAKVFIKQIDETTQPGVRQAIYHKGLDAVVLPVEQQLLKIIKKGVEETVTFMKVLNRDRMQIRVDHPEQWTEGQKIQINGDQILYTCQVNSIRDNKVVIKKVAEQELKDDSKNADQAGTQNA